MLPGLYSAAAGMETEQQQLNAVSNDLSNVSTPGYQSTILGFRDLLYASGGPQSGSPAAIGTGSATSVIGRSQLQGTIQQTGQPLDVAIQGEGYLQVLRPDGTVGLTRNGTLQVNAQGQLTNELGMPLQPPITLPSGAQPKDVAIAPDGTVSVGTRKLGQIAIVTVPAPDGLLADGDSVFSATAASGATRPAAGSTLAQGALEASNVDVSQAMVAMIDAEQGYSLASKAIQFQQQMGQIANQLKTP
jgi:flagellar basal-body rod protein FlgG